jgi:hypothetical protein
MERIPDVSQRVAERGNVAQETDEFGRVTLSRQRFGGLRAKIAGWFGASRDFTIHLDPLATAAWNLIDGRRTVGEIRVALVQQFPNEKDIGVRLGKFIGVLVSHQMLVLR